MIAKPEVSPLTQVKDLFGKFKDTSIGQKIFKEEGPMDQDIQGIVTKAKGTVEAIKEALVKAKSDYSDTITRLETQLVEAQALLESAERIEAATIVIEKFKADPASVTETDLYAAMTVVKDLKG